MCVCFFFSFFCVWCMERTMQNERKKKLYAISQTKQNKNEITFEMKMLERLVQKEKSNRKREIEMKRTLQTKSTGWQLQKKRTQAHFFHIRIIINRKYAS